MIKQCEICKKEFKTKKYGSKRKYCFECSPEYPENGTAISFIRKAIKKELIKYKGGKCENCGYNKCIAALEFHHKNPEDKKFEISDYKYLKVRPMEEYYNEVDKCELLCCNCHIEKHNDHRGVYEK